MILITRYTKSGKEKKGGAIKTKALTIDDALRELNHPVIARSNFWILCGSGKDRYLITKEEKTA